MKFDSYMVIVLIFSGWSGEWTWGRQEGFLALLILYTRLMFYPIFFTYYFLNRDRLKCSSSWSSSMGIFPLLLILFIFVVLGERVANDFVNTRYLWKNYYYFALLPFWALIGFDIGGDIRRVRLLLYKIALYGAILSYISFGMLFIGISDESMIGPMYWPFRFIVIFSFIYFLTVIVIGINRKRSAFLWLLGSSLSIFWEFYKFTIVSTVIGVTFGSIYLIMKGASAISLRRILRTSVVLIILLVIFTLLTNKITGGALFSSAINVYDDQWTHGVEISKLLTPEELEQISAGRYTMWLDGLERAKNHAWLGSGLGQQSERGIVLHNGYLDLVLGFGILGTAIFICTILVYLFRIIRFRSQNDFLFIQIICVGYISAILSANMFGSLWIQFHTMSFYMMLLGGISYRLSAVTRRLR